MKMRIILHLDYSSIRAYLSRTVLLFIILFAMVSCSDNDSETVSTQVQTTFKFTHNWNGTPVTEADYNSFQYTNANGEVLSIERLRYLISDIVFTGSSNERLSLGGYNLVNLTDSLSLSFSPQTRVPQGRYNISLTFGFNNEDNAQNYIDLNSQSFNVPENLGGGYHYMQFDGKFINSEDAQQGFNYHAIRAVDNPGENPTFPQDTFIIVNLGSVTISNNTVVEVQMNLAEWFKNPNIWNLNELNQMLMPNSSAQIQIYENGQTAFNLGDVTQ